MGKTKFIQEKGLVGIREREGEDRHTGARFFGGEGGGLKIGGSEKSRIEERRQGKEEKWTRYNEHLGTRRLIRKNLAKQ